MDLNFNTKRTMKNLKQWQIENDAEFDEKFVTKRGKSLSTWELNEKATLNPILVKDFIHSSQESLKKAIVEEINRELGKIPIHHKTYNKEDNQLARENKSGWNSGIKHVRDLLASLINL